MYTGNRRDLLLCLALDLLNELGVKMSLWFFLLSLSSVTVASVVQMRVVKETASYGYFDTHVGDSESSNSLVASVSPSNFSGPLLMQRLVGKCYNLTQERYRYTFCPFQNFTQYEVSVRWNAYKGILGIWSHWLISNNTFTAMILKNGDHCGDVDRVVEVFVLCGLNESLSDVKEPNKCHYTATFHTRYACHPEALLVYPRLTPGLQQEWDALWTDFQDGDITEKGYEGRLQKIFEKAGFAEKIAAKPNLTTTTQSPLLGESRSFDNLLACNKEYKSLQNEITKLNMELEALKLILELNKVQNRTNKPKR